MDKFELKIFGQSAKALQEGDVLICENDSVEGRSCIKLTRAVKKTGCALCPIWFYANASAIESHKAIHDATHRDPNGIPKKNNWRIFYE